MNNEELFLHCSCT